nr:MAG TPA: hypothetical protein [Caudoviricetes sp.]
MRLIELNEKIHDAYENAMRTVSNEEVMAVSYGTREAALILLKEFQKCSVSCTQDEQSLCEMWGNYFMGIAEDWRDLYESVHDHIVDEARVGDPLAQAVFAVAELAYALLLK